MNDKILSQDKVAEIIKGAPKGTSPEGIVAGLRSQGYQLEGHSNFQAPAPEAPKKTAIGTISAGLDTVFGGGKLGEAIGTEIAKRTVPKEQRQYVAPGPSATEVAGSVLKSAALFIPVGRIAGVAGKVASKVLPKAIVPTVSRVATGALAGEAYDVASNLEEGKTGTEALSPGGGTAIGATIPLVPPAAKGIARLLGETIGASTGVGYGAVKGAIGAAKAGGDQASAYREALRGKISPEQIVEESRSALGNIIKQRSENYQSQLEKLKTNTKEFNITPIFKAFNQKLKDFGVIAGVDGSANFSRSPGLGRYKKDLTELSKTLSEWGSQPGDLTVAGVDKLKQTIDDFRIGSQDSRKFDSFVTELRNEAKKLIKNEPGYDKLVGDYENSTGLIKEIQRGLSLGDRAQMDTAFRKLTTTLRTNNEFRKVLVDELNRETGGTLIPKIAGQQMSELLPRGLARPIEAVGGSIAYLGGLGIVPLLKIAAFTSPRLMGEMLNALGFVGNKGANLMRALGGGNIVSPGDAILDKIKGKTPLGSKPVK